MNKNLNSKLEELHGFQAIDTNVALTEIRSQLHELTKSVESCQSEVYEVKQDMMTVKSEIDSVELFKDEIDDIRDSLDRLEAEGERRKAEGERRKAKLSDQVIDKGISQTRLTNIEKDGCAICFSGSHVLLGL